MGILFCLAKSSSSLIRSGRALSRIVIESIGRLPARSASMTEFKPYRIFCELLLTSSSVSFGRSVLCGRRFDIVFNLKKEVKNAVGVASNEKIEFRCCSPSRPPDCICQGVRAANLEIEFLALRARRSPTEFVPRYRNHRHEQNELWRQLLPLTYLSSRHQAVSFDLPDKRSRNCALTRHDLSCDPE